MIDPEYVSLTLPYVCECGMPMRTRGVDGRCPMCAEFIPVRCELCQWVRLDPGAKWEPHPGLIPGEVMGICSACGMRKRVEDEARYIRNARAVERRAARPHEVDWLDEADWEQLMRGE